MSNCNSCFLPIIDMRKETRCSTCSKELHKDCAINDDGKAFCDVCYTVKTEEGEQIEFNVPDVIRRSYIETYRDCPYKFYLEIIKGLESPHNIYSRLGVDMHKLFEDVLLNNTLIHDAKNNFENLWLSYPKELFEDNSELKLKMYNRGIDSIDGFFNILPDIPKPLILEDTIQFSIGDDLPLVQTTSDYIYDDGEELVMRDWKTGAVMVGMKLSSDLQAPLYIYGAQQKYKKPVRRFHFHYLSENKERIFERIHGEDYVCTVGKREYKINITDGIREVKSVFSRIIKGDFNIPRDTRKMYFTCKMCYQRERNCQGADIQSWSQYNKGVV